MALTHSRSLRTAAGSRWYPGGPFNGILAGDDNTLTVTVEGRSFKFLINNQPVEGFDGGLLDGMEVFLVVSAKEGASVIFTFDNLVMQI